jgi:hypothetical protein
MPTDRGHEDDRQVDPEHPANLQDIIPDQDKENALHECKDAKRERLGDNVI